MIALNQIFNCRFKTSLLIITLIVLAAQTSSYTVSRNFQNLPSNATNKGNSSEWLDHCKNNVFPCSDKIFGNIVLLFFYGLTLGFAAKMISDGAELLLELGIPPGLIGGIILPVLGAVPDSVMILVSGIGEDAQTKLSVGMGTLAGSTILLLTFAWSVSLLLGRVDLVKEGKRTVGIDKSCTGFSLYKQGVEVTMLVTITAIIMMVTSLPYLVVQSADWYFGPTRVKVTQPSYVKYSALATMIICAILFVAYLVIQLILSIKIGSAKVERHKSRMVNHAGKAFYMAMYDKQLQSAVDNGDKESDETQGLLRKKYFGAWKIAAAKAEDDSIAEEVGDQKEAKGEKYDPKWLIAIKSVFQLLFGVFLVTFFSDPMCNAITAITNPKNAQHIPISSFYLSFIITPICSNASELVSSFVFAMKKEKHSLTLTYAQLYGAATMNNTLCLGVFAALVFFQNLEWYFSAEVTVILLVEFAVGLTALAFYRLYFVFLAFIIILLYPLSLVIVILLENVAHWG